MNSWARCPLYEHHFLSKNMFSSGLNDWKPILFQNSNSRIKDSKLFILEYISPPESADGNSKVSRPQIFL